MPHERIHDDRGRVRYSSGTQQRAAKSIIDVKADSDAGRRTSAIDDVGKLLQCVGSMEIVVVVILTKGKKQNAKRENHRVGVHCVGVVSPEDSRPRHDAIEWQPLGFQGESGQYYLAFERRME